MLILRKGLVWGIPYEVHEGEAALSDDDLLAAKFKIDSTGDYSVTVKGVFSLEELAEFATLIMQWRAALIDAGEDNGRL